MKTVTLTVRIETIVPDDCNTDDLCLHLPEEGVEVVNLEGRFRGVVHDYETIDAQFMTRCRTFSAPIQFARNLDGTNNGCMMLQLRVPGQNGGKDRLYSPDRDLAYSFQSIAKAAMDMLEKAEHRPWMKDYLDFRKVTGDDLDAAAAAYARFYGFCHLPDVNNPREALERAGWFAVKPEAQAALCMAMGQAVTCAYFSAIRDVTFDDKPPVDTDALHKSARQAAAQMSQGVWRRLWAYVRNRLWTRADPAKDSGTHAR